MAVVANSSEETENVALLDGFQRGESADDPIIPEESLELKTKNARSILARTAHQISQDSIAQVFLLMVTGVNSAFILSYSGTILVHLGWTYGVTGLVIAITSSFYANTLLTNLHELDGKRHIRYRDLAECFYGKKGYYTIWILQYLNLIMNNISSIILGGSAIQAVYNLYRDDNALKISYCNLIAGFSCFIFAILVPHLSGLRIWLGLSAIMSLIYIIVAVVLSIGDGVREAARDYSIPGTSAGKVFRALGAICGLFFPFNSGMLPELQATIRAPVVDNMLKALYVLFTVGLLPLVTVMFVGYWAYGSSTSSYLLDNVSGPVWAKALANIAVLLQTIVCFHIYACPIYEYFDTKYGVKGSATEIRNLSFRIGSRGSYLLATSAIAALLPFIGDFVDFTSSICVIPISFVVPNHMYLVERKTKLNSLQKLWHWLNVIAFAVLVVVGAVASVRLIVTDAKDYHLFGSFSVQL